MINSITLQNFKAFGDFSETLSNLNLITGLNGTGKSSVIQALLLLRQSFQMDKTLSKGLVLNGEYTKVGKGIDAFWVHGEEDIIKIGITWGDDSVDINVVNIFDADVLPLSEGCSGLNEKQFYHALFSDRFQYLHAERIGQRDFYPASQFIVNELNSLGTSGEYTTYYLERNLTKAIPIKDLIHKNNSIDALGVQIDAWLGEISPGVSFIPELITNSELSRQFYTFEFNGERTRQFRSVNVGFGLNYILPILTALLSAKSGDLLIIENPEVHIHPRGHSQLGLLFVLAAKNGVQLIVETHSDHILNGIRVAVKTLGVDPSLISLLYFNRDIKSLKHQTEVERPQLDVNGRLNYWPDGFLDEWDNALDKLI